MYVIRNGLGDGLCWHELESSDLLWKGVRTAGYRILVLNTYIKLIKQIFRPITSTDFAILFLHYYLSYLNFIHSSNLSFCYPLRNVPYTKLGKVNLLPFLPFFFLFHGVLILLSCLFLLLLFFTVTRKIRKTDIVTDCSLVKIAILTSSPGSENPFKLSDILKWVK